MPERPLLLFPTPEIADRTIRRGFPGRIHRPSIGRQGQRLSPIFNRLQTEFNSRRVELQQTAAGADPEQVLVIETIGSIEYFANAIRRIDGLEWLGEIDTDEIAPDQDFYKEGDINKELSGRLYLVMTNQRALNEMLSLWRQYQENNDMEFARGLTRFRDVFCCLKNIRRWNVQDRIEETGVLEAWQEDLAHDSNRPIRFEVELWFRGTSIKRNKAQEQIQEFIEQLDGKVLDTCIITEIAYHALLVEIYANTAQEIIDHPDVDLIKCDSAMFFRPVGQMITGKYQVEGQLTDHEIEEYELPTGDPIVAILDGLPLSNHNLLVNRLFIDDPDDYSSDYSISDRTHGTAMASLVIHGDLNDEELPLTRPVYVRPIMKPISWINSPPPELIPDDVLVVDFIHRAVHRIFEGDGTSEPSAPTIRIINYSIGDPYRQYTQALSPLARLIDWLSVKYNVLFIISAGNHDQDITTDMTRDEYDTLSDRDKEELIVRALYNHARHRRILSPGESINSITVGALHHDNTTVDLDDRVINPFESLLPSPVSAFGGGYRKSVKPDVLFKGGRIQYTKRLDRSEYAILKSQHLRIPPGNKVASPSTQFGDVNKTAYSCGTSNATALITRIAAVYHDTLVNIFEEQAPGIEYSSYLTPLIKAMVVHGCSWGEIGSRLQEILQTPENGRHVRNWISRWLGYGVPIKERVLNCTEQRATLIGFGQLSDEEAHLFSLPLPASLGARREWRRLTVTLAWISPIAARTQLYRTASLWFEIDNGFFVRERQDADWRAVRRGTVQHEVFDGDRATAITNDSNLTIKVNYRNDAANIQEPVAYGLIASLEVAEGIDIAIYNEIRTRIMSAIAIRTREGH